jgi:hypothetical protein
MLQIVGNLLGRSGGSEGSGKAQQKDSFGGTVFRETDLLRWESLE